MSTTDPSNTTTNTLSAGELMDRAMQLMDRLEAVLPATAAPVNWDAHAFQWRASTSGGSLAAVTRPHWVLLDDLLCMDRQKAEISRNTEQFIAGNKANNALLWGGRGTGKSTLVKAVFNQYRDQGLRLIEVEKDHLADLPRIVEHLEGREERFIIYCDDLTFEADDASYKSLKGVLEGSVSAPPDNVLVYATSNRRHLLPETQADNQDVSYADGELHPGDVIEEKISLSERFGLWLPFYPFRQSEYLAIVDHWLSRFGLARTAEDENIRLEALRWAGYRGSRSGRVAHQFAVDRIGRQNGDA